MENKFLFYNRIILVRKPRDAIIYYNSLKISRRAVIRNKYCDTSKL